MELSQIVNALMQNHPHCDFLIAILQWEAFHGNNKRWKEITRLFFHHINHKTSQQKIATYYLHQISQNNRINVSHIQEQKNKVSQLLLKNPTQMDKKSVGFHVANSVQVPSCTYMYKKRLFPQNITPIALAVSTLESICKSFEVSKEQLLECVYKGILQVYYRDQQVLFNYAETLRFLIHRYQDDEFVEVAADEQILPLIARGQIAALYSNKKLYIRKSDLALHRDVQDLTSIVLKNIETRVEPSFIDTLPIRALQKSLGLKELPVEEIPTAGKRISPKKDKKKKAKFKGRRKSALPQEVDESLSFFKKEEKLEDRREREQQQETLREVKEKELEEKQKFKEKREEYKKDDSEEQVLFVEEDTSETLLDVDDLDTSPADSTVPTVDFSSSDFDDSSSASETISEELTFGGDDAYAVETSDDLIIDSSGELDTKDRDDRSYVLESSDEEIIIDSLDAGGGLEDETKLGSTLQTEPLEIDAESTALEGFADQEKISAEELESIHKKLDELAPPRPKASRSIRVPVPGHVSQREYIEEYRQKRRSSLLSTMFKVITFIPRVVISTIALTFAAITSFIIGTINLIKSFASWLKRKCTKEIAGVEIPLFEGFLSEDAGQPGILERAIAQSRLLIATLQLTLGLRVVMLINLFDNLLDFVAGYINNIYRTWKISKSIHKRLARRATQQQIQGIYEELDIVRYQISRLLCLPHFCPYTSDFQENAPQETFALELVLEIRYRLDEMKRDLSILTVKQMSATAKKSVWEFITSFIPNPTELITPWKDFVIFAFFMRYSRRDLYTMYIEVLMSYKNIIMCLDTNECFITAVYEQKMQKYVNKTHEQHDIEQHIEECRLQLQRIIQMLTNAHKMIEMRCLHLEDLWFECRNNSKDHLGIRFHLEWEKRINRQVERYLKAKNPWHRREKLLFYRRYHLQKKLAAKFI